MKHIDLLTFVSVAIPLIFAAVFTALWWRERKSRHILAFAAAYWSSGLTGAIIVAYQVTGYEFFTLFTAVGDALSVILLIYGMALRKGLKVPIYAYISGLVLSLVLIQVTHIFEQSQLEFFVQNTFNAALFALGAQLLWQSGALVAREKALAIIFALQALIGLSFATVMMINSDGGQRTGEALLFVAAILVSLMGIMMISIGLILIWLVIGDRFKSQSEESEIDALSGLPRRGPFEKAAKAMLDRSRIEGKAMGFIICDIDHFKRINDKWGHATGDTVIQQFAGLINANIRPYDIAGRVGGEEFCIAVWDCSPAQTKALAHRIRLAAQNKQARKNDRNISFTASLGVATPSADESYSKLYERADAALYEAKEGGRNWVVVHGEELSERPKDAKIVSFGV